MSRPIGVARSEWEGLLPKRKEPSAVPVVVLLGPVGATQAAPVRVTADDGFDYFIKVQDIFTSVRDRMSVATEMLVARFGSVIGAPTCDAAIIRIPDELHGEELRPGIKLVSSYAHGSRALDHCVEGRDGLQSRTRNSNRQRHVGVFAIYDLFYGSDPQWLYDTDNDRSTYSHDHGLYLPPAMNAGWTDQDLQREVGTPRLLPVPAHGLDQAELERVAAALRELSRAQILSVLAEVPQSWNVADTDLEALGWFLEQRAPAVAGRLDRLRS